MSENLKHLNDETFESGIASGVALVDFSAEWCGPCRMLEPIINELADDFNGRATIAKVDIDSSQTVTGNAGITTVPTVVIFKDGKEVERFSGVRDKEAITSLVEAQL